MSDDTVNTNNYEVRIEHGDRIVIGFVLGILTFWLFANGMLTIGPTVMKEMGFEKSSFSLAVSLAALFAGCFGVVAGGIADKFGRLRLTYIGLSLSIVGNLLLISSSSMLVFSLGRVVQGISIACIMPSTMALIKDYFDGAARQRALSFWVIGSWGGSGLSGIISGTITKYMGWKWVYIIAIIIALVGIALIKGAPERKATISNHPVDKIGIGSFIVALFTLNFLINKVVTWGVFNPFSLSLAAISIVGFIVFIKTEKRLKEFAFIDFALLKNRSYLAACLSNFTLNMSAGSMLVISTYLIVGRGFDAFQAGLITLSYTCTVLIMVRVGEKLLQQLGARKPMMWGPLSAAFGLLLISITAASTQMYIILVLIGYAFFGLGLGMYGTPSTDTAVTNCPADQAGMASGFYKMTSSMGGAMGVSILIAVSSLLIPVLGLSGGTTVGLIVGACICLSASMVSFILLPKK